MDLARWHQRSSHCSDLYYKGSAAFQSTDKSCKFSDDVFNLGIETPTAIAAGEFWPGPMTLILQRKEECPVSFLATADWTK